MDLSTLVKALRPVVTAGASNPGLFRNIGSGLSFAGRSLVGGLPGMAMMTLPQAQNFGNAFDTSNDLRTDGSPNSRVAQSFSDFNSVPNHGASIFPNMVAPMDAYIAKLRASGMTGAAPTAPPPTQPAATPIPLPVPRPKMTAPLSLLPQLPQTQTQKPYGFTGSPAYAGQGSTYGPGIGQLFQNLFSGGSNFGSGSSKAIY